MAYVKFAAIGNKKGLGEYYDYAEAVLSGLCSNGYVEKYEIYTQDDYPNVYFGEVEKEDNQFDVILEFATYKDVKQLMFDISSKTYKLSVADGFLETLKIAIKEEVVDDWEKILWLYDEDAYTLSKDLYSRFYVTENKIRSFINEYMVKTLGLKWWDLLSDQSIKQKYIARVKPYRTIVQSFNKVDDHLFSIDVGDLLKILTMQKVSWSPIFDSDIESLLVCSTDGNEHKIVERLKKQLVVNVDYWDKYFKNYFDSDFSASFKEFEANRNHVAHNKILDRGAYKSICRSIDKMDEYMKNALSKLSKEKKSLEQLQADAEEYKELLMEAKQNDAGITIRDLSKIINEFEDVLIEKHDDIVEALRFREDLEISELKFCSENNSGALFSVLSKVNDERLDFCYSMDVNDDEAAESILSISCEQDPFLVDDEEETSGFIIQITYVNGAAEYDDEQGLYMPIADDGIVQADIDNYVDEIVDYISNNIESMKDYVESIRYRIVKDGGYMPVASGVFCDECGEEYICIDDSLAEVGTCLNCGAHHVIAECERCGQYFHDYDEDEIKLCDSCKDYYENE